MLDISILRQAAAALLNEAPLPVVRSTLRALLADAEAPPPTRADAPVSSQQPQPLQRLEPKPAPVRTKPASAVKPTRVRPAPLPDSAWDERRVQIREAMQSRNVTYSDLATRFRVKVATLKHALHRRQPPGETMKRRLDQWMRSAPAPAVATEPPFRPNGASRLQTDTAAAD